MGFLLALCVPAVAICAPIPLDSSNWQGPAGARYWTITAPGTYFLNVPEPTFMTSAEYAVRIEVGNVVLDGMGKSISGTAPPIDTEPGTPNLYGVRVNGGTDILGVHVRNLRVSNKYFGVIFEAVGDGRIEGVIATGNQHGLYFWRTVRTTFQGNVASSNLIAGIMCDGNAVDSLSNTIVENVTDGNGHSGIWMWDRCRNNTIDGNVARGNAQMGVALSVNANDNAVRFNTLQGNSSGIIVSSRGNAIESNLAESNANVGVFVSGGQGNTIEANTVRGNLNAGLWFDASAGSTVRRNTISDNRYWGVFQASGSSGQSVYDNYLSNASNAGFNGGATATWNVAPSPGTNAIGGPFVAGNYWASPAGTGFSETATDGNHDGIADSPYAIAAGNADAYPLHGKARKFPTISFNGDLRGDLLWRNGATGQNALWFMNGAASSGEFLAPIADPGWSIAGRESFDGDGKTDILWRHSDGRNAIWFMDGATAKPTSGYIPSVGDAAWKVAGVGDIDGDGYADIVWRHLATGQPVVWYMRGLLIKRVATMAAVGAHWQVAGVADFDGDGKAEILWRDTASGQNAMWAFDSYRSLRGTLIAAASLDWSIAGVRDFNGDGRADILWRDTSGRNAIWFQSGATTTSSQYVASAPSEWSIGWVGDCNGDGRADLVWRKADGTTALWLMNGASVVSSAFLANTAGWSLIR